MMLAVVVIVMFALVVVPEVRFSIDFELEITFALRIWTTCRTSLNSMDGIQYAIASVK